MTSSTEKIKKTPVQQLRVYGYVRLSRDEDKEQNSLNNQKKIIMDYARQKDYDIIEILEDDNISGMTFDRPGLNRLKELVEERLVDVILVKDLSRLGRHKAYTALLLDDLRSAGVKVISVTENIDNFNENDDLVIGIKQILNEQYAKDISRKIRSAFKQKQKEGLVIIPPFGYIKENGQIKIDEECAEIVRLIFKLYINGYGAKKIADYLTSHHYHTPSWYQKQRMGKTFHKGKKWVGEDIWSDRTILRIIENDAYIGTLRCGVSTRSVIYNYKKTLPKEEHIVHENFYTPIIDKETWELAQIIRKNRSENNIRASTNNKIHRYAGLIICQDCGASFVAKRRKTKEGEYIEYVCNAYHRFGRSLCTPHRIRESELDEIVYQYLEKVKDVATENIKKVEKLMEDWNERKKDYNKTIEKIQTQIIDLKEEIKQYAKQLAKNLITEELFKELTQETNEKIALLEEQIKALNEAKELSKNAKLAMENSVETLKRILNERNIEDSELQLLINKIYIKEDESGKLDVSIKLNSPLDYHLTLANAFTESTDRWVYDYSVIDILIEMINRFATLTNELSEQYNKNAGGRAGIGRQACLRGM